jgi:hypothetical protein
MRMSMKGMSRDEKDSKLTQRPYGRFFLDFKRAGIVREAGERGGAALCSVREAAHRKC